MSVYTQLDQNHLQLLLDNYQIPALKSFSEISDGIENSNYLICCQDTQKNETKYVLTIFESLDISELNVFIELMATLNKADIPVPYALRQSNGVYIALVKNKPYILCPLLAGDHLDNPTPTQVADLGKSLGQIHQCSGDFSCAKLPQIPSQWWLKSAEGLDVLFTEEQRALYQLALRNFEAIGEQEGNLPKGIVHTDLFLDNCLFTGDGLSGILDFYDSAYDFFLYDLAVSVNDSCKLSSGELDGGLVDAFLDAYESIRPLTDLEKALWPNFLQLAAFRFWLSRLQYHQMLKEKNLLEKANPKKQPDEMFQLLRFHMSVN